MRYADIFMIMRRYIASAIIPFDFLHASVSMFLDETCSFLFFYFGNVFLYEFLALSDDHDAICYSLFFCYFVSFYIFFITLPSQWYTFCLRIYIAMMRITNVMMKFPVQL